MFSTSRANVMDNGYWKRSHSAFRTFRVLNYCGTIRFISAFRRQNTWTAWRNILYIKLSRNGFVSKHVQVTSFRQIAIEITWWHGSMKLFHSLPWLHMEELLNQCPISDTGDWPNSIVLACIIWYGMFLLWLLHHACCHGQYLQCTLSLVILSNEFVHCDRNRKGIDNGKGRSECWIHRTIIAHCLHYNPHR